jgi:hypothetical protein
VNIHDAPLEEVVAELQEAARGGDRRALYLLRDFADLGDSFILRLAARRLIEAPTAMGARRYDDDATPESRSQDFSPR